MKKVVYTLIVSLVVVSGIVLADREIKNETPKKLASKPRPAVEKNAVLRKWETTPDGIAFKTWEASREGEKVLASAARMKNRIDTSADMEAVVTSLSLPPGSRLGFGVMIRINEDDYILSFGVENSNEFRPLRSLKVNDKITIRSHFVSYAPKYRYPIVAGDYVALDNKKIFQTTPRKGGC